MRRAEAVEEENGGWLGGVEGEVVEELVVLFGHFLKMKRRDARSYKCGTETKVPGLAKEG